MASEILKQNENEIWTDIPGFSLRAKTCVPWGLVAMDEEVSQFSGKNHGSSVRGTRFMIRIAKSPFL